VRACVHMQVCIIRAYPCCSVPLLAVPIHAVCVWDFAHGDMDVPGQS
jgi:hypothetical protein